MMRCARQTAEQAQTAIETHEATPHNTDQTARDAAAAAQMAAEAAAGGRPTVLFEGASLAIGASTGLIPGNVVCPPAGALEFYFEGLTGTRQGGVAYARIPGGKGTWRGVCAGRNLQQRHFEHAVNFARGQPRDRRIGASDHQLFAAGCSSAGELLLPHFA